MSVGASFICLVKSSFNASSALAIPCAFMLCVCLCVCAPAFFPARYMFLSVWYQRCEWERVSLKEHVCVFLVFFLTEMSVSFTFGVQQWHTFDHSEASQRNVFIGVKKKKFNCCLTIIHVSILSSYNQPTVSLYLRYSQCGFGLISFEMHLSQIGYWCSHRKLLCSLNSERTKRDLLNVEMFLWWLRTYTHTHRILSC